MSETKNIHDSETERDASAYFSEPFTEERVQYEFIRFLMIANNINPFNPNALSEFFQSFQWKFDEDTVRQAVEDARRKIIKDAVILPSTTSSDVVTITKAYDQIIWQMIETKNTQKNKTDYASVLRNLITPEMYREIISNLVETIPHSEQELALAALSILAKQDDPSLLLKVLEARNAAVHGTSNEAVNKKHYELTELAHELLNSLTTIIPLRIDEEPLTPQTLALAFSALTELTTKLWLIAKHRFADLIEYTQTHDVRFANEAGTTIAWATYNSPFSFGLQVDKVVPSVADAVMTIVDGLSQRKAKREQLEINNQETVQKIKEAEEALKQQQEMAELEREKREIELEKLRLENEKERQAFVEQRLESRIKLIDSALELASKAIVTVYPNDDPEMRPVFMQILVNNILQIDSVEGLQLALPGQSNLEPPAKENVEQ